MVALNMGEGLSVLFMSQCVEKALDWCLRDTELVFKRQGF